MSGVIKIIASIPVELEGQVRNYTHRKGDLSKLVVEALEWWVKEQKDAEENDEKIVEGKRYVKCDEGTCQNRARLWITEEKSGSIVDIWATPCRRHLRDARQDVDKMVKEYREKGRKLGTIHVRTIRDIKE